MAEGARVEKKSESIFELLLNGGKFEMNSATIPIQWFFGEGLIARKPSYIIFFEQDEKDIAHDYSETRGRRYVVKVEEAIKFLQIFRPGHHRLTALLFTGSVSLGTHEENESLRRFLRQHSNGHYESSIPVWDIQQENENSKMFLANYGALAAVVVEFEVPAGLFAAEPETKFSKLLWKWANLWYKKPPVDQCDYRSRLITSFTLKPIPFIFYAFFKYLVFGPIGALYILVASSISFFIGFRPKPILPSIWRTITWTGFDEDLKVWGDSPEYRLWESHWDYEKVRYMPFTLLELTLIIAVIAGIYYSDHVQLAKYLFYLLMVGCAVIGFTLAVVLAFRFGPDSITEKITDLFQNVKVRKLQREMILRAEREKQEKEFFKSFSLDKKPVAVDLHKLQKPLEGKKRLIQIFYVSFWATKAKICKPFAVK
ncbi:hypothetical protein JW977_04055 [Candidatus Falkowbacteria bacterium]|nr:hypothetical protein [Candidatus Falkowbacteria bacterium]